MKKVLLILIIAFCGYTSKAQVFAEWFRQKKTQRKYLAEQILALKAYAECLKKGYRVAEDGLQLIGDVKNGDWKQHLDVFSALKSVSPVVSKDPKVNEMLAMHLQIEKLAKESLEKAIGSAAFNGNEIKYLRGVFSRLQVDCIENLNGLKGVTTAGGLEMTDDERIQRLAKLYEECQSQYRFIKRFCNDIAMLMEQKRKERQSIIGVRELYGN